MADSRCANPDYALDVDEMMLEYLLYSTTKAHLYNFRSRETPGGDGRVDDAEDNAATLLQAFDQFLAMFRAIHPEYHFPPDVDFSIKLLQFVVLYTNRKSPRALSSSSRDQLKLSSQQNSFVRKMWWESHRLVRGESSPEESIIESWRGFFATSASSETGETAASTNERHTEVAKFILLLDLLPQFLDLSANMAATLGQDVNEQWMLLAAEFMLQSAWEKHVYLDAERNEEPLKVAFGWDRWDYEKLENTLLTTGASSEVKGLEVRVDGMFRGGDRYLEEAVGHESSSWSNIKLDYLSAFGRSPNGTEGVHQAQRWQVKRLKAIAERFPMKAFDSKIVDYIEGLWELGRKPLLVQIEQGKVEGLNEEEFKEFMRNVFPKGSGNQEVGRAGQWWN